MLDFYDLAVKASVIGAGATLIMDSWNLILAQFGIKSLNFGYLGRWIGHLPKGVWAHTDIASASPIPGELILGYIAHYSIGITFAAIPLLVCGLEWVSSPKLTPAILTGTLTVAAPYLILQPALGLGIAASKAANPTLARIKSLASHVVYGFGIYMTALAISRLT